MKRALRLLLLAVILAAGLACALLFLVLEAAPGVPETRVAGTDDAARVRALVKRSWRSVKHAGDAVTLSFTEDELNSLARFVARGAADVRGHAAVADDGISVRAAFALPAGPFGRYLNLRFRVDPSEEGLRVSGIRAGSLPLPGGASLHAVRLGLDLVLGNREGTLVLDSVQTLRIEGKTAVVRLRPRSYLELRAARIRSRLGELRDSLAAGGDPAAVRLYFAELTEADQELAGEAPVSLARFVGAVFGLARQRGGDPVEENRAALLALATFLGSGRFEAFVGPVRTAETKAYRPRARRVVLGGREDLRLHFLISAGLEIVSDTEVTYAVGEFKELLDAHRGGSGFSFADLAADRAGVRFARQALESDEAARRLQAQLAGRAEEASFFPDVRGLPEGLTQERFEKVFQNVESDAYRRLVAAVDGCIERLPAFAGSDGLPSRADREECRVRDALPPEFR